MARPPIILTEAIVPPPALIRAGLDALPFIVRVVGERASRRFIEFFTAAIRNRNTRLAYARGKTVLRLVRRPRGLKLVAFNSETGSATREASDRHGDQLTKFGEPHHIRV